MSDITVKIPEELVQLSGLSPDQFSRQNIEIWVFNLYADGKITLSKAAQLLETKIDLFLTRFKSTRLRRTGAPLNVEEAESDEKVIEELIR